MASAYPGAPGTSPNSAAAASNAAITLPSSATVVPAMSRQATVISRTEVSQLQLAMPLTGPLRVRALRDERTLRRQRYHQATLTQLLYGATGRTDRDLIVGRQVPFRGQPGTCWQFPRLDPGSDVVGNTDVDVDRPESVGIELGHLHHEDHPRTPVNCSNRQDASCRARPRHSAL